MFKHIVMWNIKEGYDKKEVHHNIRNDLRSLMDIIPEIYDLDVLENVLEGNNRDIILIAEFKKKEDFLVYKTHPEHLKVVEYIKSTCTDRVVIDVEI